jgi:hypothetical protein
VREKKLLHDPLGAAAAATAAVRNSTRGENEWERTGNGRGTIELFIILGA